LQAALRLWEETTSSREPTLYTKSVKESLQTKERPIIGRDLLRLRPIPVNKDYMTVVQVLRQSGWLQVVPDRRWQSPTCSPVNILQKIRLRWLGNLEELSGKEELVLLEGFCRGHKDVLPDGCPKPQHHPGEVQHPMKRGPAALPSNGGEAAPPCSLLDWGW
jgi:hypothetical protein